MELTRIITRNNHEINYIVYAELGIKFNAHECTKYISETQRLSGLTVLDVFVSASAHIKYVEGIEEHR